MVSGKLSKARIKGLTEKAPGGYRNLTFCRMIKLERENRWSWELGSRMLKRKLLQTVSMSGDQSKNERTHLNRYRQGSSAWKERLQICPILSATRS